MKPMTYTMNKALVVVIEGEFDAHMVAELRPDFEGYSEVESNVLIDLSDVYFVDSSGIGALVFLYKRLAVRGYRLSIINVNGQPADLFEMLHLNKTIRCYDSVKHFLAVQNNGIASEQVA